MANNKKDSNKNKVSLVSTDGQAIESELKGYDQFYEGIAELLQEARRLAARSVNAIMTISYWELGRHIVENEQGGKVRAAYGEQTLKRLSDDLTGQFGKGFSYRNLRQMRQFYQTYPFEGIWQTLSAKSQDSRERARRRVH